MREGGDWWGLKENRPVQKKTTSTTIFKSPRGNYTSLRKIAKILRFQTVSSGFLYFHENFRKLLFF